jgi:23S rRNA (cytidine1920-2'-O)/16S rRNA (cytidine1409-2'-O)-methyltransferase
VKRPQEIRSRLDLALVERGLLPSRARARDAILRGCVLVDGRTADRPAAVVTPATVVIVDDPLGGYVSRGAAKLIAALDEFRYDVAGRRILDIGASTGGFTQVLLERGAARVIAVDVGHGQFDPKLVTDPRVTLRERTNARDLTAEHTGGAVEAIVADVSFISLKLALPPALALAARGAWGVFLAKPQFEVGPKHVGKGGIVRDAEVAHAAADHIATWLDSQAWSVDGILDSPIAGGDGNHEFLIGARLA